MGLFQKLGVYAKVMRRARRPFEALPLLRRRPALFLGVNLFEVAQLTSGRVDTRLKTLAELKTASLVGCEFCCDIGTALGRALGITEQQLLDLHRYESSPAFDELDRLVLDLAVVMARTPTVMPDDLMARLRAHFDERQLVELTSAIAWEHYRGRFNQVFGIQPSGFSEGTFCVLPENPRGTEMNGDLKPGRIEMPAA